MELEIDGRGGKIVEERGRGGVGEKREGDMEDGRGGGVEDGRGGGVGEEGSQPEEGVPGEYEAGSLPSTPDEEVDGRKRDVGRAAETRLGWEEEMQEEEGEEE